MGPPNVKMSACPNVQMPKCSNVRMSKSLSCFIEWPNLRLKHLTPKRHFKDSNFVVVGLGLGSKIIRKMCNKNRYDYLDIRDILNSTIVNGDYLSNLFPAFVLNRLS